LTNGYLEEKLRTVLASMLHKQFHIYREIELLPAARHASNATAAGTWPAIISTPVWAKP